MASSVMLRVLLFFFVCFLLSKNAGASSGQVVINVQPPTFLQMDNPKMYLPDKLRLGIISTPEGSTIDGMRAMVQYINNNASILPNVAIELYMSPYSTVDTSTLFNTLYYSTVLNASGVIGAQASSQSKVIQSISKLYNIPQLSPTSFVSAFSDKTQYPYFARTIPSDQIQIDATVKFFVDCKWKKGIIVYSPDEYGNGYSNLVAQASKQNISFLSFAHPATVVNSTSFLPTFQQVKAQADTNGYRIIIIYITFAQNKLYAIQALNATGLVGPEYVIILTGSVDSFRDPATPAYYNNPILDGAFAIGPAPNYGPMSDTLIEYWQTLNITQFNGTISNAYYAADCILAFAYATDKLVKSGIPFASITGAMLLNAMFNLTFLGTTGNVTIDQNGDRIGAIHMWNFRYGSVNYSTHVGTYDGVGGYTQVAPYVFYGGSTTIPRDSPYICFACEHGTCVTDVGCVCESGYIGSDCSTKASDGSIIILPWLIPLVAVLVGTFGGVYYIYRRKRSALVREVAEKQRSQIARADLNLLNRIGRGASGEVWKAQFRGTEVAVKKIVTNNVSKAAIEEFELEVAIMCGLRHPNIILFMGSCFEISTQEMFLVMEFMSRGSLNDVLNNPKVSLPYEMKLSLACQAAQGMNFLHQSTPPLIHHDLKSHNILIDDKWNARISDFGITRLKEDASTNKSRKNSAAKNSSSSSLGTIYWSAPEILRGDPNITEKCDCYSFGIVLWEIFHQQNPYAGKDPMAVVMDVLNNNARPKINSEVPLEIQDLMKACWATNPEDRPAFQSIMNTLRSLMSTRTFAVMPEQTQTRVDAPTGQVYLVASGVEGAYKLWEAIPRAMEQAMKLHNQIIRKNLEMYTGYEASFQDHTFLSAFGKLEDAINFCTATQNSLLHAQWPNDLLDHPLGKKIYVEGALQWVGLRVKMSINSGVPNCEIDNGSGRIKYLGPVVEKTEGLLGLSPGYIIVSDTIASEIPRQHLSLVHEISVHKIGEYKSSSARNKLADVHQLCIKSLHGRDGQNNNESGMSHAVIDIEGGDTPGSVNTDSGASSPLILSNMSDMHSVNWISTRSEIGVKESIGKGPIGDYFRAFWRGKEVAVKVLVNQKLKEDDIFRLIGDSAYMSKLVHPNILPFHAVCLEPNYICVVSEFESRGNLKQILADSSISLAWSRKVKIAIDLAQGLSFLASTPDATLQIHDNLKSNNVLIGKDWEVKVADYGHGNIRELARTMTSVGNIAYTAPEILNGDPANPKSALYAYGMILWEILTRQVPYANEHPIRAVSRILNGFRPTIPPDCPDAYKQIILECWDVDPENRPSWFSIISLLSSL